MYVCHSFRLGYRLGHVILYILYHLLCVVVLSCSVYFFTFCKTGLSGHGRGLCQCGAGDQQLAVLYFSALSLYTVHDFKDF